MPDVSSNFLNLSKIQIDDVQENGVDAFRVRQTSMFAGLGNDPVWIPKFSIVPLKAVTLQITAKMLEELQDQRCLYIERLANEEWLSAARKGEFDVAVLKNNAKHIEIVVNRAHFYKLYERTKNSPKAKQRVRVVFESVLARRKS